VKRFHLKIRRTIFGQPYLAHLTAKNGHYVYAFEALEAVARARRDGYERALIRAGYMEGSRLRALSDEFEWINQGLGK
jgi:hypothetical protein